MTDWTNIAEGVGVAMANQAVAYGPKITSDMLNELADRAGGRLARIMLASNVPMEEIEEALDVMIEAFDRRLTSIATAAHGPGGQA